MAALDMKHLDLVNQEKSRNLDPQERGRPKQKKSKLLEN